MSTLFSHLSYKFRQLIWLTFHPGSYRIHLVDIDIWWLFIHFYYPSPYNDRMIRKWIFRRNALSKGIQSVITSWSHYWIMIIKIHIDTNAHQINAISTCPITPFICELHHNQGPRITIVGHRSSSHLLISSPGANFHRQFSADVKNFNSSTIPIEIYHRLTPRFVGQVISFYARYYTIINLNMICQSSIELLQFAFCVSRDLLRYDGLSR